MTGLPWFKFYPGDIAALTDGMSLEDYAIAIKLISRYAATGKPIASESLAIWFPLACDRAKLVLKSIFTQENQEDAWVFGPVKEQLDAYEVRRKVNSANAKTSKNGDLPPNRNPVADESLANGERIASESQANRGENQNQNQKKDINTASASGDAPSSVQKPRTKKAAVDRPDDVSAEAWDAWMGIRKAKRVGALTDYALQLVRSQCRQAGITLAQAIDACIERGWASFRAEWYTKGKADQAHPQTNDFAARERTPEQQARIDALIAKGVLGSTPQESAETVPDYEMDLLTDSMASAMRELP